MTSATESRASEHAPRKGLSASTAEDRSEALLDIAIEAWRLGRLFKRVLERLDTEEQPRYRSQFEWFDKKLKDSLGQIQLRIETIEGHPFDSGQPVTALNLEEFKPGASLTVDKMIEPIIMGPTGVVRAGTVTVKRVKS